ncbi:MAG TPA: metal ABC transporter permease [Acidothermaceae bacterium]|jgi:zinc/manganese transport system permease protein
MNAAMASAADAPWSWNLIDDFRDMWSYPFMVNAFRAGSIVAVVAGVVGWFMVLRKQSFAGHTLAISAFPGAAAATLLGISATVGYFAFAIAAAVVVAVAARPGARFNEESAVIGTLQAFALACGYLFVYLYKGFLNSVNAPLFGSSFAITDDQVLTLGAVAAAALGVLVVIGRPLFFASVDSDVAAARGVRVRLHGAVFLVVLGAAAAEASQIAGALLVFSLLVMPAATAQRVTPRPVLSLGLTVVFAVVVTWAGLVLSYYALYPLGFCISSFAFGGYLLARLTRRAT